MIRDTTSEAFFEKMYRKHADPWNFASSDYEQQRYAAIFTALSSLRYERAFEPGCSIGILTEKLASICDRVAAMDISPTAVQRGRQRCRSLANVEIFQGALPGHFPDGTFDLIVLSEIGYYFDEAGWRTVFTKCVGRLRRSGILLAAHWLGISDDHLLSGARVHEIAATVNGLRHKHAERHDTFLLDHWERS